MFPNAEIERPKNDFQFYKWALLTPMRLSNYTKSLSERTKLFRYVLFFLKISVLLIAWCAVVLFLLQKGLSTASFEQLYNLGEAGNSPSFAGDFEQFSYLLVLSVKEFFPLLLIGFGFGLIHAYLFSTIWFVASLKSIKMENLSAQFYFDIVDAYRQVGGMGIASFFLIPFLGGYFHPLLLAGLYGLTCAVYFALTYKPGSTTKDIYSNFILIALIVFYSLSMIEALLMMIIYISGFFLINRVLLLRWVQKANEDIGVTY